MATLLITDAIANAMIVAGFPNPGSAYASLHTATPGKTGASEVAGGTYARQSCQFAAPVTAGTELTSNAQNWTGMPSSTVTYFGVWSALAGTYWGGGLLGSSLTVPAGATVAAAIGALSVAVTA
jgi:hypothetical protein